MYTLLSKWTLVLALMFAGVAGSDRANGQTGPLTPAEIQAANAKLVAQEEASRVHLIVTGFTSGPKEDIGASCGADLIAIQSKFSEIFRGEWRGKLEVHALYGTAWKAEKIRQYLQDMQVGANDTVLFYFAGHGCILNPSQASDTHQFCLDGPDRILRGEIRRILQAKQCRGIILMSDTCSSISQGAATSRSATAAPKVKAGFNRENIRNLFLRFRGLVDLTAAEIGTQAGDTQMCFHGACGAFTVSFLRLISDDRVFSSWEEFFPALRTETGVCSNGRHQAFAFTILENKPNGASPSSGATPLVTGPIRK